MENEKQEPKDFDPNVRPEAETKRNQEPKDFDPNVRPDPEPYYSHWSDLFP